jgi:hypothetical protein
MVFGVFSHHGIVCGARVDSTDGKDQIRLPGVAVVMIIAATLEMEMVLRPALPNKATSMLTRHATVVVRKATFPRIALRKTSPKHNGGSTS